MSQFKKNIVIVLVILIAISSWITYDYIKFHKISNIIDMDKLVLSSGSFGDETRTVSYDNSKNEAALSFKGDLLIVPYDELIDILSKYKSQMFRGDYAPFEKDHLEVEFFINQSNKTIDFVLGEYNYWISSGSKRSNRIIDGDKLLEEIRALAERSIEQEKSSNYEKHRLTMADIEASPFYRPDFTIEKAIEEGLTLIESTSGIVYGNELVEYTYYNWETTPVVAEIKSSADEYAIMGIKLGDTYASAVEKLPIEYDDWQTSDNHLIYGKLPDYVNPGDYAHGSAYADENGIGTITFVPTEYYPFVQFIIKDFKVFKVYIHYYDL
ncbi:MAG: hypothetical protein BGO41_12105 [Clostridiales bacterium 38-18]|nr:MAG: hypothetical protein BGO41_12105 [Clostridiales bacterium 38-18]